MSGGERMQRGSMTHISAVTCSPPATVKKPKLRKVSADPKAPLGACRWRGNLAIPQHSHWAVRALVKRLNAHQTTMSECCARAGIARTSIWNWANSYHPRVDELEAALNAVGLRLRIEEMDE